MKQNLQEEIRRQLVLMGLDYNIIDKRNIMEAVAVDELVKIFKTLVRSVKDDATFRVNFVKDKDGLIKTSNGKYKSFSKYTLEDILKVFKSLDQVALGKHAWDFKLVFDNTGLEESFKIAFDTIQNAVSKGMSGDEAFRQYVEQMQKTFFGRFRDLKAYPRGTPENMKGFTDEYTRLWKDEFEKYYKQNNKKGDSADITNPLSKNIDDPNLPLLGTKDVKDVMNFISRSLPSNELMGVLDSFKNFFRRTKVQLDEITMLTKTLANSSENATRFVDTQKAIIGAIGKIKDEGQSLYVYYMKWLDLQIEKFPQYEKTLKKLREDIKQTHEKGGDQWINIVERSSWDQHALAIKEAWSSYRTLTKSILSTIYSIYKKVRFKNKTKKLSEISQNSSGMREPSTWETFKKVALTGSRRGYPSPKALEKGDYKKLVEIGGKKVALWSFRYERIAKIFLFYIEVALYETATECLINYIDFDQTTEQSFINTISKWGNQYEKKSDIEGFNFFLNFVDTMEENVKDLFTNPIYGIIVALYPGFVVDWSASFYNKILAPVIGGEKTIDDALSTIDQDRDKVEQQLDDIINTGTTETNQQSTETQTSTNTETNNTVSPPDTSTSQQDTSRTNAQGFQ